MNYLPRHLEVRDLRPNVKMTYKRSARKYLALSLIKTSYLSWMFEFSLPVLKNHKKMNGLLANLQPLNCDNATDIYSLIKYNVKIILAIDALQIYYSYKIIYNNKTIQSYELNIISKIADSNKTCSTSRQRCYKSSTFVWIYNSLI